MILGVKLTLSFSLPGRSDPSPFTKSFLFSGCSYRMGLYPSNFRVFFFFITKLFCLGSSSRRYTITLSIFTLLLSKRSDLLVLRVGSLFQVVERFSLRCTFSPSYMIDSRLLGLSAGFRSERGLLMATFPLIIS